MKFYNPIQRNLRRQALRKRTKGEKAVESFVRFVLWGFFILIILSPILTALKR